MGIEYLTIPSKTVNVEGSGWGGRKGRIPTPLNPRVRPPWVLQWEINVSQRQTSHFDQLKLNTHGKLGEVGHSKVTPNLKLCELYPVIDKQDLLRRPSNI